MHIEEIIDRLKKDEPVLAPPIEMGVEGLPPMSFSSHFSSDGATRDEFAVLRDECPPHLITFWNIARTACLFEDEEYGQWGLMILSPHQAIEETVSKRNQRPQHFIDGDLVIGRFLGDSDSLIIRCNKHAQDFGRLIVALPIDPRSEWYSVAESFEAFLERYTECGGRKYWEEDKGGG